MKRLIIILILLAYGFSSWGMTLHVHYCCGRVDAVRLVPVPHHCPVNKVDKNEKQSKCCDDRQLEWKIKTDYKNEASKQLKIKNTDAVLTLHDQPVSSIAVADILPLHRYSIFPPPSPPCSIYKTNCNYRI